MTWTIDLRRPEEIKPPKSFKGMESKDLELLDDLARRHISYSKDSYLLHLQAKKANLLT